MYDFDWSIAEFYEFDCESTSIGFGPYYSSNELLFQFHTDNYGTDIGFSLKYRSIRIYGIDLCAAGELIGNGYCNDEANIAVCEYDGGDCCGPNVNTEFCYQCTCLGFTVVSPGFPLHYESNIDWTKLVQVSSGKVIKINFISFELESQSYSSCR